jgi:hypothetical protein
MDRNTREGSHTIFGTKDGSMRAGAVKSIFMAGCGRINSTIQSYEGDLIPNFAALWQRSHTRRTLEEINR